MSVSVNYSKNNIINNDNEYVYITPPCQTKCISRNNDFVSPMVFTELDPGPNFFSANQALVLVNSFHKVSRCFVVEIYDFSDLYAELAQI
jgi:hypothetical protein